MVEKQSDEDRAAEVARIMDDESLDRADKIRSLLDMGYSAVQIERDFGFSHSTVYQVAGRVVKPARSDPVEEWDVPAKLDRNQMIPPEQALRHIRLQDGEYKLGFIDGISVLLIAGRYNQMMAATQSSMMEPMIKLMQNMRQEEREAAEKARGDGKAIASEAAQEVAGRVAEYVDQRLNALDKKLADQQPKKPDIASTPNPMMGLMARSMEVGMNQLMGNLFKSLIPGMAQAPDGQSQNGQPPLSPGVITRTTVERGT